MGSMAPTPTAEKRAAFTLAVGSKAAPTAVKWAAYRVHQRPTKRGAATLAVVSKAAPTAVERAA